ncbi:MAG: hypothetical protein ACLUOF_09460 [Ruminococcus sp.]
MWCFLPPHAVQTAPAELAMLSPPDIFHGAKSVKYGRLSRIQRLARSLQCARNCCIVSDDFILRLAISEVA